MTKEEAKEYIDNYLSHIIAMVEYGNWFADKIKAMAEEAKDDCDKILKLAEKCNTIKSRKITDNAITERLEQLISDVTDFILEQTDDLINIETDWLNNNVAKPLNISFDYSDKFKPMLLAIPIAAAGVVGEYGKTISDRLRNIYHQEVMQSYVTGTSFEELEEYYEPRFNTFDRGLKSDSETLGSALSGQYDRMVYTKNDKKISGYIWQCVLDGTTCIVCGSFSNRIFKTMDEVPMYPIHDRDRCQILPLTKEIEENIPESYSDWFESQSNSEKYKILGKTRFQLYEQGMKIKSFVNNGKKTPIADLKK